MAWLATSLLTAEAAVNVAVSPSADAIGQLNNDALDAAAFEAIRDDHLEAAENAFAEIISRDSEDAFAPLWLGTVAIRKWDLRLAEKAFAHAVKTVDNRMWVEDENEGFALGAKHVGESAGVLLQLAAPTFIGCPLATRVLRVG